jgi:hypothetical protein
MSRNADSAMYGMVTKPNSITSGDEHDGPVAEHDPVSNWGNRWMKRWYPAMSAPMTAITVA